MKYDLKSLDYSVFYHVLIVPWMAEKVQTFFGYFKEIFDCQRTACLC